MWLSVVAGFLMRRRERLSCDNAVIGDDSIAGKMEILRPRSRRRTQASRFSETGMPVVESASRHLHLVHAFFAD